MAFVIKFVKGVRNHWKKSIFAAVALTYGCNYAKEYYEIQQLMRVYCKEAAEYGKAPIASDENPRHITIILNPNANKRKAMKEYEKYCAPILNLAGIYVDVIQTDAEGHAKTLMDNLEATNAVVVAGGDGTLSEVVTGLMRKSETNKVDLPIGVLPLGRTNTIGNRLFPGGDHLQNIRSLADASLAVIKAHMKPIDVMKIEVLQDEELQGKVIYAVSSVKWGAYRDAQARKDKYWYFGPLRSYATYIFNGYKSTLSWNCNANINYTLPCEGCKNCVRLPEERRRWYHRFLPYKTQSVVVPRTVNALCEEIHQKYISTSDFAVATTNALGGYDSLPQLKLNLGPNSVDYFDFVSEGWRSEHGHDRNVKETILAKEIEIKPDELEHTDRWFSIDNEEFELKPVKFIPYNLFFI
ncbi:hypothetical protein PPYR_10574 [Photinus pyralis]|uniref:Acylglycerol kinase, mitochondrial n=1 Tax=Photinus pyralis TaxID=7054 RepID=A0A5N4AGU3_PHOPY|nr:hypothetical protein PPYR_10574 [Photinus pyralis]